MWAISRGFGDDPILKEHQLALCCKAATQGCVSAMGDLDFFYPDKQLSLRNLIIFQARRSFLTARCDDTDTSQIRPIMLRAASDWNKEDLTLIYLFGREIEGFEQIWEANALGDVGSLQNIVDIYLTIAHRARAAALHTFLVLHRHSFPRDLCVLFAQRVYDTREESAAEWYRGFLNEN